MDTPDLSEDLPKKSCIRHTNSVFAGNSHITLPLDTTNSEDEKVFYLVLVNWPFVKLRPFVTFARLDELYRKFLKMNWRFTEI